MPDQDKVFAETLQQSPVVLSFFSSESNISRPTIKAEVNYDTAPCYSLQRAMRRKLSARISKRMLRTS